MRVVKDATMKRVTVAFRSREISFPKRAVRRNEAFRNCQDRNNFPPVTAEPHLISVSKIVYLSLHFNFCDLRHLSGVL